MGTRYLSRERCIVALAVSVACGRDGFQAPVDENAPECSSGFTRNGEACTDIDECVDEPCHAFAVCRNEPGSFMCECASGFSGDGRACFDIDDCGASSCGAGASCVDGVGSFACACDPPLVGDGNTCVGCGDGTCDAVEGCLSCSLDCGACSATCDGGACMATGLVIVDAATLLERGPLTEGAVLTSIDYPGGFGVRVVTEPVTLTSVVFDFNGTSFLEQGFPFAVGPNSGAGSGFSALRPLRLGQGLYTATATPFGGALGVGVAGRPLTRSFSVLGDLELPLGYYAELGSPTAGFDAEESVDGSVSVSNENINLGAARAAFRFVGVALDAAEPIAEVVLRFTAGAAGNDPCPRRFFLSRDTTEFPPAPNNFNISMRSVYTQSVVWDVPVFVEGTTYETPNLLPLLAERLNEGGFDGRLLVVAAKEAAISCTRRVVSADIDINDSATLVVRY